MILYFSGILYGLIAFATMVIVYHWAINTGNRVKGGDELASVISGILWPLTLFWVSIYSIVPLVKMAEKFMYKRDDHLLKKTIDTIEKGK